MAREVNRFLGLVFAQRPHKGGRTDLEAVESALRAALHQAGAAALAELLKFEAPAAEQRQLPCSGGPIPSRSIPGTPLQIRPDDRRPGTRPPVPTICVRHAASASSPVDAELDIENTEYSPRVRRMQAIVGQESPFEHGREQMKVQAGLEVTTKSVERTAEIIGADIAQREQAEIQKALQLDLPVVAGEPIPFLYVQMDGTGSSGGEERDGRSAGQDRRSNRPILGKPSGWDACSPSTTWDTWKAIQSAIPIPPPIAEPSRVLEEFGRRIYGEAWGRGWSRALKKGRDWRRRPNGFGILLPCIFPTPCRLLISTTPASIFGRSRASCTRMTKESKKPG